MSSLRLPYPWEPGEHVTVIGDTGSGKSTLMGGTDEMAGLLDERKYLLILRSKPDEVRYHGVRIVRTATPAMKDPRLPRLELSPAYEKQPAEFGAALELAWRQKGWTIYIDEGYHVDRLLSLRDLIDRLLTQGRSLRLTAVIGLQRPVAVSRFAISQSTHVICFAQEGRDAKTVADATTPRLVPVIEQLGRFEFVWYHRKSRTWQVLRLQDLQALSEGGLTAERAGA